MEVRCVCVCGGKLSIESLANLKLYAKEKIVFNITDIKIKESQLKTLAHLK